MKLKISQKKKIVTRITAIVMGVTLMGFSAYAAERGDYKGPKKISESYKYDKRLYSYNQTINQDLDKDSSNGNETRTVSYRHNSGDLVVKYSKKSTPSKIWGWNIYSPDSDIGDISKNHFLVDSNDDGNFDLKYKLTEDVKIPDWAK